MPELVCSFRLPTPDLMFIERMPLPFSNSGAPGVPARPNYCSVAPNAAA